MRRITCAIAVILVSLLSLSAAKPDPKPDFAYPATTLKNAERAYDKAMKNPDASGLDLVRSMLEITAATAAIDFDSVASVMPRYDRAIGACHSPSYKALLMIAKAETLNSIYQENQWQYDRSETPDEPLPADIHEWNGRQFAATISSIADEAVRTALSDKNVIPLEDCGKIINSDNISRMYFPDVRSFVALKAVNLMSGNGGKDRLPALMPSIIDMCRKGSSAWFRWKICDIKLPYASENIAAKSREMYSLYLDNKDNEAAGIVLARIAEANQGFDDRPAWLVGELRSFISRFPSYWDIESLRNSLDYYTRPELYVWLKNEAGVVPVGRKFDMTVRYRSTDNFTLSVYRVDRQDFDKAKFTKKTSTLSGTFKFSLTKKDVQADTVVSISVDAPGYYAIVPSMKNVSGKDVSPIFAIASGYMPAIIKGQYDPTAMLTVDYSTGAPVKGIAVTEYCNSRNAQYSRNIGSTDGDGMILFTPKKATDQAHSISRKYKFTDGKISLEFPNISGYSYYEFDEDDNRRQVSAQIFTDRQLYHPGDTLRWSVIIYKGENPRQAAVVPGFMADMILNDANSEPCDTVSVTTDELGLAHGFFVTPTSGLTGRFSLWASHGDDDINNPYCTVTVSDFKLPTFSIDSLKTQRAVDGSVTLSGLARTYSGMSVADAKVDISVKEAMRFRWFMPLRQIGTLATTTDAKGNFSIVLPDTLLRKSETDAFMAEITVTSADGEAQKDSKPFTTGRPYTIFIKDQSFDIDTDGKLPEIFEVYNAESTPVDIALRWTLTDNVSKKQVASGQIASSLTGLKDLGLARYTPGDFRLELAPVDTTLAEKATAAHLYLYSISRNLIPAGKHLFVPQSAYTADDRGSVEINVGTGCDEAYIYTGISLLGCEMQYSMHRITRGFKTIKFSMPDSINNASVIIFSLQDGVPASRRVTVSRPDRRKITLEGSSIRDRLSPGSEEQWTLKLRDAEGRNITGGLIATMFADPLNALAPYHMPDGFGIYSATPSVSCVTPTNWHRNSTLFGRLSQLRTKSLILPSFTPGLTNYMLKYGNLQGRSGIEDKNGTVSVILGCADAEFDEVVTVGYAAAPKKSIKIRGTSRSMAAAAVTEETAVEGENDMSLDESAGQPATPLEFSYRDSEVLQAFWMPRLVFDNNGEANINFVVPDANTTWSFNAFAWTDDLRATTLTKNLVASKPVMVKPNLPRFLREGDKARVLATVYNNSDDAADVKAVVEIFDVNNGDVISAKTCDLHIAAGASDIVAVEVAADGLSSMIGYRVRATLGRFTDGEQTFIPVLPSTSAVIESENFYLNPDEASCSVTISKGKDMQSTLDYTANPAWNIIKELPGLAVCDPITSTSAARKLFGAATARGLLTTYPALASVIKAWNDDPDSKALTSRLESNDQLKAAVLTETPWVQAAASDSRRMARLSLLFDKKATDKSINATIDVLKKLQNPDGGFAWGDWNDRSSLWATNIVLQDLGRLNALGYLPEKKEVIDMLSRAIAYYESQFRPEDKRDEAFTYITTLFPDVKIGLTGQRIVNATVSHIAANWKSSQIWDKSMEAMILDAKGYKAVARQIIGSLSEFAVQSKTKGVSFPNVDNINDYSDIVTAFRRIAPDSPLIDGMCQWLVIQQQTTSQFFSVDPTRLIAAFAGAGTGWFDSSESPTSFTVDGRSVVNNRPEFATGHIVSPIPADYAGKRLDIVRSNASVPAYGSVISRYKAKSTEVKASSCDDLSVEKRISAFRDGAWKYVDEVRLGEQVRIILTVKARRDLEYVTVVDGRPASLEPVDQLPGWTYNGGVGFYRENRDSETRLFVDYLPAGTYQITVGMTASVAGTFTSGIATVQSQLAPSVTAHSAGSVFTCE